MQETVLHFWFEEATPRQWWVKDPDFDALIAARFAALHARAAACELHDWRSSARGRLAEIIVLDQFSRNLYRDQAGAFACDRLALGLAQEAVAAGADRELPVQQRLFLYMPYMHSESWQIHRDALPLFESLGLAENLDYEKRHMAVIERFGRYPHRNALLGRTSSAEELAFLQEPGSRF